MALNAQAQVVKLALRPGKYKRKSLINKPNKI
jgi:hypothetical protein